MKLTKQETKLHQEAEGLLTKRKLTDDEQEFVLLNWHPGAEHNTSASQTYFTPMGIAQTMATLHGGSGRVVDCCAGIGRLASWMQRQRNAELTCIEINPEYVRVGKKLVPEAKWVLGSIFDELPKLPRFDSAIGNPPFGKLPTPCPGNFPNLAHMAVAELLTEHTEVGAILLVPEGCDSLSDWGSTREGIEKPRAQRKGTKTEVSEPQPGEPYQKFRKLHPGWEIAPTSWDSKYSDPADPKGWWNWRGTNLRVRMVDLHRC